MFEVKAVPRKLLIRAAPIMLAAVVACGGGSGAAVFDVPVPARVIVTSVQVSADDELVEYITVLMDNGEEITMKLGEEIDPAAWDPGHLLAHAGLGESLGLKIGVTYIRTAELVVAIQLSE